MPEAIAYLPPGYAVGTKFSTRKAFGNALSNLCSVNPTVVSLDGDTKNSTFAQTLKSSHEGNFIECFIAEQNMVGVAAGLSCRGKVPFVSAFTAFLERACDQIRIVGLSQLNVKFVGTHSGVSIGEDGPSQMSLEDLGFFRALPQSVVLVPSDATSAERAIQLVAAQKGIAFVRTSRSDVPVIYSPDEVFTVGKCTPPFTQAKYLSSRKQTQWPC